MQQSAAPQGATTDGLPHTHARPRHWLVTAVGVAAVTGVAAFVQPTGAGATSGGAVATAGPDATVAEYPLDCGPFDVLVTDQAEVDLDADGQGETVAVVRCDAGSGSPPNGMYLLTHAAGTDAAPEVTATLVDPGEQMTVDRLATEGAGFSARLVGYSSPDVRRCCPDLQRDVRWEWRDGRLELIADRAPNSV
ncbi:hypothetical protein FH609_022180 [Streptomyces sp. 3MP-14]|uniref:Secreted protein n=1 Tax=Streptomyces mimosae TaxID=2586635 RepID=A0A5N6A209_9ACTN|nr:MULTISPECIES: hypothetical protein [Streptomyces]KAB8162485.1 hypothetical protein FH607_020770 [Streptomyces mimosae]KAB8174311.1 hypothetical protein FH609_022180 [Streptomyces sp. 3MP-14]